MMACAQPSRVSQNPPNEDYSSFQDEHGQAQLFYASISDHVDLSLDGDLLLSDSIDTLVNPAELEKARRERTPSEYMDSLLQRYGEGKYLENWFPDSGASAHFTPMYDDLINPKPDILAVLVADGTIQHSTHKGEMIVQFPTDEGEEGLLRLRTVRYVPGLSHRLFSLLVFSAAPSHTVAINNHITTLRFRRGISYTWPISRNGQIGSALTARVQHFQGPPDTSRHNGIMEKRWQEPQDMARALCNNARLGKAFYFYSRRYAAAILNVLPAKDVLDSPGKPLTSSTFLNDDHVAKEGKEEIEVELGDENNSSQAAVMNSDDERATTTEPLTVRRSTRTTRGQAASRYDDLFAGMVRYFEETDEPTPTRNGILLAMNAVETTSDHPVSMYLPEPQSFRAVLTLPDFPDLDFRSAVCYFLYLAYNTRPDILFIVCKLAKACSCPGYKDYEALVWLIGYICLRPDLGNMFYSDVQDDPDTGRSTVGYVIFCQSGVIDANSTVPVPIAMSTSAIDPHVEVTLFRLPPFLTQSSPKES